MWDHPGLIDGKGWETVKRKLPPKPKKKAKKQAMEKSPQTKEVKGPEQSPKSTRRHFTLAYFIIPIKGDEDKPKIMHCNHITRSKNPWSIYLPEEENDEYLSDEVSFEEILLSFYIFGALLGEEDDK